MYTIDMLDEFVVVKSWCVEDTFVCNIDMLDEFVVVKTWCVEDTFVCITLICSMSLWW